MHKYLSCAISRLPVLEANTILRVSGHLSGLFFFQAEDGIRYHCVTGVQTCALPISAWASSAEPGEDETRRRLCRRSRGHLSDCHLSCPYNNDHRSAAGGARHRPESHLRSANRASDERVVLVCGGVED